MATVAEADALTLLSRGEVEVQGRLVGASNATLYCTIALDGVEQACVYKPVAGERGLWDFPEGTLAGREVAAYLVSRATGWRVVPPTVYRDGPFGPGSLQLWIDQESEELGAGVVDVVPRGGMPEGWLRVLDAHDSAGDAVSLVHADNADLARMAALDVVLNNADRKGGHVLGDGDGGLYGVDHGLTFNEDEKLRTVLWGWAGRRLPDDTVAVVTRLAHDLDHWCGNGFGASDRSGSGAPTTSWVNGLADLITPGEIGVTGRRARALAGNARYPRRADGWPAIPWPPF
jgi:uncharacterized repeat protein (TIGR03843 family)